jgi:chromosome segregation ATPase
MKVVDEKKALDQIAQLKRQKKSFTTLDDMQKQIDTKKAENADLRKTFDSPEARELRQRYDNLQAELDELKASRESGRKNVDALKKEREDLYQAQQTSWEGIRKVKDDYYNQRREYKKWEDNYYQQQRERKDAERKAYEKEKRQRIARDRLEEAGEPAFLDEIRTAESLIKHFDPSRLTTETETGPSKFAASAQRTVDDSGFKGMKVVKKDEEDFFVGSGGKKKGKGKKGPAAAETKQFNMNIGIIEELAKVGVDPPSTQDDVPGVVTKLEEKLATWKKNQKEQTDKVCPYRPPSSDPFDAQTDAVTQNVEKAKKEIEKLEKEADEASAAAPATSGRRDRGKKTAQASVEPTAEAQQEQEKNATDDVAEDLKAAKIEDSNGPEVVSA